MPHLLQHPAPRSRRTERPIHAERVAAPPKVSVCIANWNCRELLRNCLRSILDQPQGVPVEIIVVDNASTDGAADMVAHEFPEVPLIRNDSNLGFATANNQAAGIARGDVLFFLNNDTVAPPGAIGELADFVDAHPDAALVGPRLVGIDGRPQRAHRKQPTVAAYLHRTWLCRLAGVGGARYRAYRRSETAEDWPSEVEMLLGAAVLVTRARFEELGGWDEGYRFGGEDLDFCMRARRLGPILYNPRVAIAHVPAQTKENIAFASPRILAGFARFFRQAGASRRELFAYKLAVTVDAPLQIVANAVQAAWRLIWGRRRDAKKRWNDVRGAAAFLTTGLVPFWRA